MYNRLRRATQRKPANPATDPTTNPIEDSGGNPFAPNATERQSAGRPAPATDATGGERFAAWDQPTRGLPGNRPAYAAAGATMPAGDTLPRDAARSVGVGTRLDPRARSHGDGRPSFGWHSLTGPENLLTNLVRLGFMLMVVAVLGGVWVVASAHLQEQLLGAPQTTSGLIDPTAGDGALTPDNIEQQVLSFNLRLRENELAIAPGVDPRPRPFTVNPGEAARFIAARLQSAGFVHDADLFNLYLRVNGLERGIEAGNFMLAETMTIPEVAEALQTALFEEVLITIPEGFRAEEIAERLAENNVIEPDRFLAAIRQPRSLSIYGNYSFLEDLPADASLEGYLFPDTYRLPVLASTPEVVIAPFLNNFRSRAGNALNGGASGFSGRELLTLASIVEREAVQADERPIIASVYVNRLAGRCVQDVGGTFLQADPTVQYARGTVGDWWWQPQSLSEYATVISPYNTYLHPGLPPGPIASPGQSAIEAASNPTPTDYCFFLGTGEDGRHVFARTLAEHEQNFSAYGY